MYKLFCYNTVKLTHNTRSLSCFVTKQVYTDNVLIMLCIYYYWAVVEFYF